MVSELSRVLNQAESFGVGFVAIGGDAMAAPDQRLADATDRERDRAGQHVFLSSPKRRHAV